MAKSLSCVDVDRLDDAMKIDLKPGMGWAMYSDNGPGGPCGQSCSVTCPHTVFATWPDEQSMRDALARGYGRNKRNRLVYGVVGQWTSGGRFMVVQYE